MYGKGGKFLACYPSLQIFFKIRGESSNLLRETEERMEETNHIEILEVQVIKIE